jgi:hypothetical protein
MLLTYLQVPSADEAPSSSFGAASGAAAAAGPYSGDGGGTDDDDYYEQHHNKQSKHRRSQTGGSGGGGGGTQTRTNALDTTTLDPRRAKRILANRQSAQRSRMKRLQYIHDLEGRSAAASATAKELQGELDRLAHQQVALSETVEARKAQVSLHLHFRHLVIREWGMVDKIGWRISRRFCCILQ